MTWRGRGDWRWVVAALLIAALVFGLGFILRASGLSTAANVAQLVALAPVVVGLANWPRAGQVAKHGAGNDPSASQGESLRTIAYARGLTGQDVKKRLANWDGETIDAFLDGTRRPSRDFVTAFLDVVAGDDPWHRELLEQRLRTVWQGAEADRPDGRGARAAGEQQTPRSDEDDWLKALREAAITRQDASTVFRPPGVSGGATPLPSRDASIVFRPRKAKSRQRHARRRAIAALAGTTLAVAVGLGVLVLSSRGAGNPSATHSLAIRKTIGTLTDPGIAPRVNSVAFSPGGTTLAAGDDTAAPTCGT